MSRKTNPAPRRIHPLCLTGFLILWPAVCFCAEPGQGWIAFTAVRDGKPGLFVMNADGSSEKRLTTGPDFAMAWSPDSRRIVFRRTFYQTYIIDADGSNETLLRSDGGDPSGWQLRAHFSPDGTRIVTHHGVIGLDGSDFTRTHDRRSWSPDGSQIVFSCGSDLICTADADGSAKRELHYGFSPAWSPDGTKFAFISGEHGTGDLLVMSSDGEDVTLLTDGSAQARFPTWSPDGSRISFITGLTIIEVISADGRNRIRLTDRLLMDMDNHQPIPSWSPDGSKIVFTGTRSPYSPNQKPEDIAPDIYTVNADGSNLTQLTKGGMSLGPVWSPTSETSIVN